jgi:hypothetical protein
MSRSKTVAIVTIVLVAAGAALAGAAVDRAYVHRSMRLVGDTTFHPISSALRTPSDADRQRYRAELSAALSLTAEQSRSVDSILDQRASQFESLRSALRPRVDSLVNAVRRDIDAVLTPAQRDRYRALQGGSLSQSR